ncbi:MAG: nucleotide sugar epimerase, partial [Verrucomicrobia bacterium]|nr:nucleotide sugar epimerase [Verrucomicrobiota bacterium]
GTIQALSAGDPGEVFNIAGGEERTINEALAIIEAGVGKPLNISRHPAARGDQERTRGDSSRAQEKLGFISNTRLEDGLGEQIKWQQNL